MPAFAPVLSCCELPQPEPEEFVQVMPLVSVADDDVKAPVVRAPEGKLDVLDNEPEVISARS